MWLPSTTGTDMGLVIAVLVGLALAFGILLIAGGSPSAALRKVKRQSAAHHEVSDQSEIVEAIATWTENLRDTISASAGLEQAIFAGENHAPKAIKDPVQRLIAGLKYGTFDDALRRFADDIAHPTCDFVVAALITSAVHQTRDVAQLLTHLSECARSECHLYMRIWVSRARMRTAVRIITGSVLCFVIGLVVFNATYLKPFVSIEGGVVLILILSSFAFALVSMQKMSNIAMPSRFLAGRSIGVVS